jgi:hypothetical protein
MKIRIEPKESNPKYSFWQSIEQAFAKLFGF